mmetsp:Transcript_76740/g.194764  ORF Transcript_76740/g.194764 Transcript_76740/m.194764 type:complete len:338 (+) Transcript_76740:1128-2141(+)
MVPCILSHLHGIFGPLTRHLQLNQQIHALDPLARAIWRTLAQEEPLPGKVNGLVQSVHLQVQTGHGPQEGDLLALVAQVCEGRQRLLGNLEARPRIPSRQVRHQDGIQGNGLAAPGVNLLEMRNSIARHLRGSVVLAAGAKHLREELHGSRLPILPALLLPSQLQGLLREGERLLWLPGLHVPIRDALQFKNLRSGRAQCLPQPQSLFGSPDTALEASRVDARGRDAVHRRGLPFHIPGGLEQVQCFLSGVDGFLVALHRVGNTLVAAADLHAKRRQQRLGEQRAQAAAAIRHGACRAEEPLGLNCRVEGLLQRTTGLLRLSQREVQGGFASGVALR